MKHFPKSHRRLLAFVATLPLLVSTLGCAGLPVDAVASLLNALGEVSAQFREVGTTKADHIEVDDIQPTLTTDDRSAVYPGDEVRTTLTPGIALGASDGMYWTPPANTGEFVFSKAPENPNGPPPFRWHNLRADEEITITYPAPHPGERGGRATEVMDVSAGNVIVHNASATLTYAIRPPSPFRAARSAPTASPAFVAPSPAAGVQATKAVTAWVAILEVSPPVTLTQQYCEALQREDVYLALRLPVQTAAPNSAAGLPLLHAGDTVSRFSITANTGAAWSTVVTNTLALRSTRIDALTNNLPGAAGAAWSGLGAAGVKPCPEGLNASAWKITAILFLDSANIPAGGYPFYLCADSAPVGPGAAPAQNCLGPQSLTLTDWAAPPPFNLSLSGSAVTTATQTVQFAHQLRRLTDGAISFTLDNRSTLDSGAWAMFHDKEYDFEPTEPDFTRPITPGQPLNLALNWLHFWVVKTIPADSAPGQHSVTITATQAGAADEPWVATVYDTVLVAPDQMPPPKPPPCTPLTGLTLTHSDQRDAFGHTFTLTGSVTPPTATLPVSYTIQVDGVPQRTNFVGGHAQMMTMTWPNAGAHTVSIAARACGQPNPHQQTLQVESLGRLEGNTLFLPAVQRAE